MTRTGFPPLRTFLTCAALGWLWWSPAAAQTPAPIDAEGLMVCALVYGDAAGRLAITPEEQANLLGASGAYAAAVLHLIGNTTPDVLEAEKTAEALQARVLAALQAQSAGQISRQDAIIAQWMPWCDAIGPQVSDILARRAERGW